MNGCVAPETSHVHETIAVRSDGRIVWRQMWNPADTHAPRLIDAPESLIGDAVLVDLCCAAEAPTAEAPIE